MANLTNVMANFAGVATALELFHVSRYVSVPMAAVIVWLLVVKGTYASDEKIFLGACVTYIAYIVAAVLISPDWEASALGSVRPVLLWDTAYLTLLVALVGTSVAPWMQFYLQAAVVEKGITVKDYAESRIEAIVSFLLFSAGLLNASLFAARIQPLSTAYSVCEGLGFESGVNKRFLRTSRGDPGGAHQRAGGHRAAGHVRRLGAFAAGRTKWALSSNSQNSSNEDLSSRMLHRGTHGSVSTQVDCLSPTLTPILRMAPSDYPRFSRQLSPAPIPGPGADESRRLALAEGLPPA